MPKADRGVCDGAGSTSQPLNPLTSLPLKSAIRNPKFFKESSPQRRKGRKAFLHQGQRSSNAFKPFLKRASPQSRRGCREKSYTKFFPSFLRVLYASAVNSFFSSPPPKSAICHPDASTGSALKALVEGRNCAIRNSSSLLPALF